MRTQPNLGIGLGGGRCGGCRRALAVVFQGPLIGVLALLVILGWSGDYAHVKPTRGKGMAKLKCDESSLVEAYIRCRLMPSHTRT